MHRLARTEHGPADRAEEQALLLTMLSAPFRTSSLRPIASGQDERAQDTLNFWPTSEVPDTLSLCSPLLSTIAMWLAKPPITRPLT